MDNLGETRPDYSRYERRNLGTTFLVAAKVGRTSYIATTNTGYGAVRDAEP